MHYLGLTKDKKMKIILLYLLLTFSLLANSDIPIENEDFSTWLALFALGGVGILALFTSSRQLENFQKKEKKQTKENQAQDQILSSMSENIQNIAKETLDSATKIANLEDENSVHSDLKKVINSENQLLSITTNLIEFLRIKSKKIKIVNEKLKLSNLLNDITGTLKTHTKNIDLELTYNVDANITENLKGDTLNLSKIIINILLFCVHNGAKEIKVTINRNAIFNKKDNLYFHIISDIKIDVENSENIFNSNYNEETNRYDSLGLFISKELSKLMGGELIARNDKNSNVEFLFNIPYHEDTELKAQTTKIESKKILLVDSSPNSATIIQKIFQELNHKVFTISQDNYLLKLPDFSKYDIVIIDEKLFTNKTVENLKSTDCVTISLKNLFQAQREYPNSTTAKFQLHKPLTKKQADDTIKKIYLQKPKSSISTKKSATESELLVHRATFKHSLNVDLYKFVEFRGTNVLLVEDNIINQKVFMGVLGKSGMNITLAENGLEALEILSSDKKFDIVFMDINMPIMDGYSATIKIRNDAKYDKLPVVALSALTSIPEIDKMFSCGMNGFLAKPLKKEQLFTVFTLFISKKSKDRRATKRETNNIVSLDGLNVALGIYHSSSNEIFYKEILLEFRDAYGSSDKIFEKLVNDFRYEQLKMLCLDVKGLSGSIGAEDMHHLTIEILQKLIYKKYDIIPSFIDIYSKELSRLNNSIDKYLD
jgi:CheY-like chemotaxis protein/signal transduction histidine kinase